MPRHALALALIALAVLIGCAPRREPAVVGSGTLEVTEVSIAPMVPARVGRMWVAEGDGVRRGDTLVSLTQATLAPDIAQREARVAAAEATLRDLTAGARQAELARAEAELRSAEAEATRTADDLARNTPLAARGTISAAQLDALAAAARTAAGRRDAARESLRLLREGTRPERIQQARAEVESARAALRMAEATASDLVLTAPDDGTVLRRYVEPGEVVAAGATTLTMADLRHPWIRVYLPAPAAAAVRVGQAARAMLVGVPGRDFTGRVAAVATKAEFTPRAALTEQERADLLFGVKVEFADTTGMLKAGLPATVVIDTARAPQGTAAAGSR